MSRPVLFGAAYSVYVRAARLALEEKGAAYRLAPVDIFAAGGPPPGYLRRHPFGRIPAFEHDGFRLYESRAIALYVDEAFPGPPLLPATPRGRARVHQIVGLLDSYAYRPLVWGIYVERVERPREGRASDETRIAQAVPQARTCLAALAALMDESPYLAGGDVTLADLHAAPMIACFRQAPEGGAMLAEVPALARWWDRLAGRASLAATAVDADGTRDRDV
jgi:glutathione S-transferase